MKLGGEIRKLQVLESQAAEQSMIQFPMDGTQVVAKPKYQSNKVFINSSQYFDKVPRTAWEFSVGGHHPAQKWLIDRTRDKLEPRDIIQYQKIIVALSKTIPLVGKIDEIGIY